MAAPNTGKIYTAVVLDWETGGLNPNKNGVTQIGMQAIRLDTFEIFASYKTYVKPYHYIDTLNKKVVRKKKDIEAEKAMLMEYDWEMMKKYTGITRDMMEEQGLELPQVVAEMVAFFESAQLTKGKSTLPIIIGQNIGFDIGFLQQVCAYTKTSLKNKVATAEGYNGLVIKTLDTIDLARLMFAANPKVSSYSLGLLCGQLDIDLIDAHDALADVEATGDVVRVLANKMRSSSGDGETMVKEKQRNTWRF